jgi:RNase H-fold protein (predicted Holliday junction resolvase)
LNECCQSDLPQLKLINEKLKTEAATRRLIEKYSIEKITNLIDEITAKVK